jgi:hypothetical protein
MRIFGPCATGLRKQAAIEQQSKLWVIWMKMSLGDFLARSLYPCSPCSVYLLTFQSS